MSNTPSRQPVGRLCPFCRGASTKRFGQRLGARYLRCQSCNALFMDLSPQAYASVHDDSFTDAEFLDDVCAFLGEQPNHEGWTELASVLGPGSVLEIGPGTGHVLAAAKAAGRRVVGVESSATHRRFIAEQWGLTETHATLAELPPEVRFDNVILVNVLEHVYDPIGLFNELRAHVSSSARVFVSTVNARGITGSMVNTYWAMFKPRDHVSFPSRQSLAALAQHTGYRLERSWSGELPLETPLGLLVAARDFVRERRHDAATSDRPLDQGSIENAGQPPRSTTTSVPRDPHKARTRRALAKLVGRARAVDPTHRVIGALGRAASVKGVFVPLG